MGVLDWLLLAAVLGLAALAVLPQQGQLCRMSGLRDGGYMQKCKA